MWFDLRVLVTGGLGFIGSHLSRRLVDLGYDVVVLDDLSHACCAEVDGAEVVKANLRYADGLKRALNGVEAVYHLAALTDVSESIRRPLLYHSVNTEGTLNLLDCCRRVGVDRIIYTSSCAVYGEPVKLPIGEDHPTNPLSPYAASKLAAEAYCRVYAHCYPMNITVFRLFNVYGPRQSSQYAGVISRFVERVKAGKPPIIYGSGEQSRDFIHVSDVVDCLVKALNSKGSGFTVFNLGSGRAVKISEVAEIVLKLSGRADLKPIRKPARRGEVFASCADVSRVEEVLGFKARKRLEEGLTELLQV